MESVVLMGEETRGEAVIETCKQGDRDAFRRLVEQHKRRRVQQFGEGFELSEPREKRTQEDRLARAEIRRTVGRAVASLKPKLRVVMLLKYFEEMSYEEIACVLGLSKGTVASRLNRGHKVLARKLGHLRGELVRDEREG